MEGLRNVHAPDASSVVSDFPHASEKLFCSRYRMSLMARSHLMMHALETSDEEMLVYHLARIARLAKNAGLVDIFDTATALADTAYCYANADEIESLHDHIQSL